MFLKVLILLMTSGFALTSAYAFPHPTGLIGVYFKYRDRKEVKEKLDQIHKDLEDIKGDLNLIIDSHLKAAMSALSDAKDMVNPDEKIDSIRSAKHFLTRAINIEKDPDRKVLAYYILGHVYLLLNEETTAQRQFKKVIRFRYGVETSFWNKNITHSQTITQLKRDASGILCSYNEQAKRIKDNWCALHTGYLHASKISLIDLEGCLHSEKRAHCERVGFDLLQSYLNDHELKGFNKTNLKLNDPFTPKHHEAIKYSKYFLFDSCHEPKSLSSVDHFRACYGRAQVLFHENQFRESLAHYQTVCEYWFKNLKGEEEETLKDLGQRACQSIYKEPLWHLMAERDKLGLVKSLCLDGDQVACGQILKFKHFYHPDLLYNVSSYVARKCLLEEQQAYCDLIDQTRSHDRQLYKVHLKDIQVGRTQDGNLWDLTGDSNPEVLLEIRVGGILIYHQQLEISEITSDADGNPTYYTLKLSPKESILIDQALLETSFIQFNLSDVDSISNDKMGEYIMPGKMRGLKAEFGAVKILDAKLITVQ
jgi:hypothetical protein